MLPKFLQTCRVTEKGAFHNWVSLKKGRFDIPAAKASEFKTAYLHDMKRGFTDSNSPSLCFRPPTGRTHYMFNIDIDLRLSEDVFIETPDFVHLGERISLVVAEEAKVDSFRIIITRKMRNYLKKTKNKPDCWASGLHMYILGLLITPDKARSIRKACAPLLEDFKEGYPLDFSKQNPWLVEIDWDEALGILASEFQPINSAVRQ